MPHRVLVVEDDPLVRDIVGMIFDDLGWQVIEATTGEEALQLLKRRAEPDLLFTDIRMPGKVDGWTLAEEARRGEPDLPVIYVSGYSDVEAREVPKSIFLQKPCRTAAIYDALRRLGFP
jgi:CheY-like chemotaxis protein